MPTALITGAGRGIGFELARQYVGEGWRVIGTARSEEHRAKLRSIGAEAEFADMGDVESLLALARRLDGTAIDVLIANAAVVKNRHLKITEFDLEAWTESFRINSIAPAIIAGLLLNNVSRSASRKLVAITSGRASIGNNDSGSTYTYRASKAALNAIWRNISVEEPGVIALLIHPGRVRTDMGSADSELSVEESVEAIRAVIEKSGQESSGKFMAYSGAELPW